MTSTTTAARRLISSKVLAAQGLLLRAIAELIQSVQPNPITGWTLIVSAGIQFLAGLTFVINSWNRVRVK